jgi:radical SAM superfamily enzyme YgiQ (UPF0313 family)
MKVTLIHPRMAEGYQTPAVMEPLALAILAALTPKGHTVRAIDERIEEVPFSDPTDLVAISVSTFSATRAYEIAAKYRQSGVPVVMGGFHPTLQPEEVLQHADAVAVGDAEGSWPQVLGDAAAGRLQRLYSPTSRPSEPVQPDRSVFRGKKYLPLRLVQFGRGCPRACEFCAVRAFHGGGVTQRPVDAVVEELRACRARRVFFVDDNLLADRGAFRRLMEAIRPLRLRWSSQMELSIGDEPELLKLAWDSGCQSLTIGFESLSEGNLRQMGKGWNHPSGFAARLTRIRQAGIMVYGTFLFGYDQDDSGSFRRTLEFALSQKLFIANFNPLQPIPGTPLYERLQQEGRLLYERWWMEPGFRWQQALLRPRNMTPEQLTEGCRWARERFHDLGSIARRLASRPHLARVDNLVVYLASNWVSRVDIRAKARLTRAVPREAGAYLIE